MHGYVQMKAYMHRYRSDTHRYEWIFTSYAQKWTYMHRYEQIWTDMHKYAQMSMAKNSYLMISDHIKCKYIS